MPEKGIRNNEEEEEEEEEEECSCRDSSVSLVTRLRSEDWGSIPDKGTDSFFAIVLKRALNSTQPPIQ
jgi:hypothetical protein